MEPSFQHSPTSAEIGSTICEIAPRVASDNRTFTSNGANIACRHPLNSLGLLGESIDACKSIQWPRKIFELGFNATSATKDVWMCELCLFRCLIRLLCSETIWTSILQSWVLACCKFRDYHIPCSHQRTYTLPYANSRQFVCKHALSCARTLKWAFFWLSGERLRLQGHWGERFGGGFGVHFLSTTSCFFCNTTISPWPLALHFKDTSRPLPAPACKCS